MGQVLLGHRNDAALDLPTLSGMFQLRHRVFHDLLGWDVKSEQGMERDEFDELDPIYLVAKDPAGRVEGSSRLLPTTGPYMLQDIFPQLLRGETAPRDEAIWEISRLAVNTDLGSSCRQANLGAATFAMFKSGIEFALENGIHSYVFVTSVALERLLRRAGLPVKRFGDGRSQQVGVVRSVACWLPINHQTCRAIEVSTCSQQLAGAA